MSDMAWLWNSRTRVSSGEGSTDRDWEQLLLLCHNCRDCAEASEAAGKQADLLLPDRDRTFTLNSGSPFVYELQPVEQVFLDENGEGIAAPETVELALVRGTTPAAQATVDYFALNTRYYDSDSRSMRIPYSDYLSAADRRVSLRTEAWHAAAAQAEKLKKYSDPGTQKALRVIIAQIIEGRGFWSTWATVLWQTLGDRSAMVALLMPPGSGLLAAQAGGAGGGGGEAGQFQGTRSDWLDAGDDEPDGRAKGQGPGSIRPQDVIE